MADDDAASRSYQSMGRAYALGTAATLAGVPWWTFALAAVLSFGLSYWHWQRQA